MASNRKDIPVRLCTGYGCIFHGFKVPVNALFGTVQTVPYVFLDTGRDWTRPNATRLFSVYVARKTADENNPVKWYKIRCGTDWEASLQLNHGYFKTSVLAQEMAIALADYINSHKGTLMPVKDYRPPYWEGYMRGMLPKEKRAQHVYMYKCKPCERVAIYGDYVISRDSSMDRPQAATIAHSAENAWEAGYWAKRG